MRNYSNTASVATLTAGVTASVTAIALDSFTGYPVPPFAATVDRGQASEEIILVTAVAGSTVTVTRGYDGTLSQAHSAGAKFEHTAIASDFREAAKGAVDATAAGSAAAEAQTTADAASTAAANAQSTANTANNTANAAATATTVNNHTSATAAHGATGAVVGTTNTQTLTNKTLTTPTITNPAIKDAGGATVNHRWVQMTQTAYNALGTKDPATLYAIVG